MTSTESSLLAVIVRAVLHHRGHALFALFVLLAVAIAGATRLRLEFSSAAFFADDERLAEGLENYHETWGPDDDVLLVVVSVAEGTLLEDRNIRYVRALERELAGVGSVRAISSFLDLPLLQAAPRTPTATIESFTESARAEISVERAAFVPALLASDGKTGAIAIQLAVSSDDLGGIVPVVEALESVVAGHRSPSSPATSLAGVPAIRGAFFGLTLSDQMRFVPLTIVIVTLALGVAFRSFHGIAVPLISAAIPLAGLLGVMGFTDQPIGLLNQAYFTVIPVIAIADAVHIVVRIHDQARQSITVGVPVSLVRRHEIIIAATARVGVACLLTTVTTGVGFLSLLTSETATIRAFGLYAAIGIFLAYLVAIVVVPLAMSFARAPFRPSPGTRPKILPKLATLAFRRPRTVLALHAAALVVAGVGALRVDVDSSLTGLLDADHPVAAATDRVDRALGGSLPLAFDLRVDDGNMLAPDIVDALDAFETWAGARPEVRSVLGPNTALRHARALVGTTESATRPLHERIMLASAAALEPTIDSTGRRARMVLNVRDDGGRAFEELAVRAQSELRQSLPARVEMTTTGTPYVAYSGINRMGNDLRTSLLVAFAVISGIIGLLLRSLRIAAICMLPNVAPLMIAYGLMGFSGMFLDPIGAVILTLALGIAVDDTIHLIVRVREGLHSGTSSTWAAVRAVERTGLAVVVTSIAISCGFAVNVLSSFPPLRVLGWLGTLTILAALICDLLLLPSLLAMWGGSGSWARMPEPTSRR